MNTENKTYQKGYRFTDFEDLEKFRLTTNGIVRVDGLKGRFVVGYEFCDFDEKIPIYTLYTLNASRYGTDPAAFILETEPADEEELDFFETRTGAVKVNLEDIEVTGRSAPAWI